MVAVVCPGPDPVGCLGPVASCYVTSSFFTFAFPSTFLEHQELACENSWGPGCPPWGSQTNGGDKEQAQRQMLHMRIHKGCWPSYVRVEYSEKASWRWWLFLGCSGGWIKLSGEQRRAFLLPWEVWGKPQRKEA